MKQKTLKDIEMKDIPEGEPTYNSMFVHREALKAEAVKWVKSERTSQTVKMWIKHFFNLTEEDLK